jgi:uracil-DNA glycosylase
MAELGKPLGEILDYLREIGFEHVYLRGRPAAPATHPPSDRHAAPPASAEAASAAAPVDSAALGWEELEAQALACRRCRLAEGRNKVVFGSGNREADLLFIGEGPGAEEDRRGLPFVGAAGELLTKIIQAMGMTRDEVYIANIVKCRPPGNRDPLPDEVVACRGFLEGQVRLVAPKVIVALGRVAAQVLLGNETPIGRMRGKWYHYAGSDMMVTYHPAALLRNADLKRPTWEDMQLVRDRLRSLA